MPSDTNVAPGGSRGKGELLEGFYTKLDGGLETMLCWGPNYESGLYWGNT